MVDCVSGEVSPNVSKMSGDMTNIFFSDQYYTKVRVSAFFHFVLTGLWLDLNMDAGKEGVPMHIKTHPSARV
jgi:hypothetical protein